jgi:hypothetical protein
MAIGARPGLKSLWVAPAAPHALYYLDALAVQVLALEAKVHPTLVATVGCLLSGKDFLGCGG